MTGLGRCGLAIVEGGDGGKLNDLAGTYKMVKLGEVLTGTLQEMARSRRLGNSYDVANGGL